MLEYQKIRIHERSRMQAKGFSEEEIRAAQAAQELPFKPAFENGKRRPRQEDGSSANTGLFSFQRPG